MIGGGAFILLKSGGGRDETANQAEAGLAGFPQIACMELCAMASGAAKGASATCAGCVVRRIPTDMANSTHIDGFVI
jgi:hypothetical protein